jgi:hypothetical protein
MARTKLNRVLDDQRRYDRIACRERIHYAYGPGYCGSATALDASLGGLGVRLGRYLRPGTLMLLRVRDGAGPDEVALKARVAWCRGAGQSEFVAGIKVFHSEPEATLAMEAICGRATHQPSSPSRVPGVMRARSIPGAPA